jgi:hypothetical protein
MQRAFYKRWAPVLFALFGQHNQVLIWITKPHNAHIASFLNRAGLKLEFGETRSLGVEVADTEGHSRVAGILGVLEQPERCLVILMPRSHSTAISGDRWPDDVRLSDVEPSFTCKTCGKRGADVRPDFDWNRQQPVAAMGYHWCPGPAASMYRSNCRMAANSERFLTLGVTLRLCPSPSTTAPSGRPQFIFC